MSTSPEKTNLGRGLAALFGDDDPVVALDQRPDVGREVPIEHLHPNPDQPRQAFDGETVKELAVSIQENGILQPILVRAHPELPNQFQIVAGERRWRAAQLAKLHRVPVVIRQLGDAQCVEVGLVENLQRQDLGVLEEAAAYQKLIDEFDHTQESLAKTLGKSRSHVANTVRLLGLPEAVQKLLAEGQLTAGHARALLSAKEPEAIAAKVVAQKLNVRQTESLVKDRDQDASGSVTRLKTRSSAEADKDPDTRALEEDLTARLGLKVSIDFKDPGGTLSVRYRSLDQLDDLIRRLEGEPRSAAE